jgi:hypothetical protein
MPGSEGRTMPGRLVRFEYRSEARCYLGELFACHSYAEIQAVIEGIDGQGARQDSGRADAGRSARVGRRRADLTIEAEPGLRPGKAMQPIQGTMENSRPPD